MDVQHALESHPSINGMCDYVGISRSGYYQREKRHNHQSPRKLRKKFIQGEIKAIWLKSLCIYGAGKITQELRSKGYKIAERTVGKYMRDRGSQFTSEAYNQVTANMTLSYSKKAYPWDNACIESFHALIKREWINRFKIHSYSEAKRLVFQYIETFYNTVRIHSHCGFKSPKQLEDEYQTQIQNLVVA